MKGSVRSPSRWVRRKSWFKDDLFLGEGGGKGGGMGGSRGGCQEGGERMTGWASWGSVRMRIAALVTMRSSKRGMGRIAAMCSRDLVGVVRNAPVMSLRLRFWTTAMWLVRTSVSFLCTTVARHR